VNIEITAKYQKDRQIFLGAGGSRERKNRAIVIFSGFAACGIQSA
jgi:hypothetical protein